jgi:hypothetical protein
LGALLRLATDRSTVLGGLGIAAVVGTLLNAINQGDRLLALRLDDVVWWKVALTYLVPFLVSVFSAARVRMVFAPGLAAHRDARLACRTCDDVEIEVRRGDLVPRCPTCGAPASWRVIG